jgi:glutamate dehydrogenase
MYFQIETPDVIARHIMGLYAAKMTAYIRGDQNFTINLEQENEESAVYIHDSLPGVTYINGANYEKRYV